MFSCLADLTSLLRLRDDNDVESVLSKEVVSDTVKILRILGTFIIDDPQESVAENERQETTIKTKSTNSISASSEHCRRICLFIGSEPMNYESSPTSKVLDVLNNIINPSTCRSKILQKEFRYFCSTHKCFRMSWTLKHTR